MQGRAINALEASFANADQGALTQVASGTDVKPIECVFFLRNVESAGFFEQMQGRSVRAWCRQTCCAP